MSIIHIKYSLFNILFYIKQVILHLKCSVSSTVTKFVITSDTAQYSEAFLSATSASDE